jgi:hypothetical protein
LSRQLHPKFLFAGTRTRWSLRDAVVSVQLGISLTLVMGSLLV